MTQDLDRPPRTHARRLTEIGWYIQSLREQGGSSIAVAENLEYLLKALEDQADQIAALTRRVG